MSRPEIARRLRELIVAELRCPAARVRDDAEFGDSLGGRPSNPAVPSLGASSLEKISVVCGIENRFGIRLSDDEVAFCKTVGTAIDLVETKLENRTLLPRLRMAGL